MKQNIGFLYTDGSRAIGTFERKLLPQDLQALAGSTVTIQQAPGEPFTQFVVAQVLDFPTPLQAIAWFNQ